ncbi:MAG: flagellar biosynthesis anti-sigma factor FlgM [Desulfobacteraceae bacterium]|nr:MAG: flagellar biosynthesis anti-sigma factor FlgM [Desulfobacteraceae bacterium]
MKIDEIYKNVNLINNAKDTTVNNRAVDPGVRDPLTRDEQKSGAEVDFSKTSIEYSQALAVMEKEPIDRVEKVEALRTKIEDGTYRVDSKKTANKMVDEILNNMMES